MPSFQQYQALPVEEKLDDEQLVVPPQISRWSKTRIAFVFSLLFLVSFTIVAATARALTRYSPIFESSVEDEDPQWLREHLTRTTGDTYLIGVGKADITG